MRPGVGLSREGTPFLRLIWVATTLALLVPGAATAGVPSDPPPEAEDPVTAPADPVVVTPAPSPLPQESSITITLRPPRDDPRTKQQTPKQPAAATTVVATQPEPEPEPAAPARRTTPRSDSSRRSVAPEPATRSSARTTTRSEVEQARARAAKAKKAVAKRSAAKRAAAAERAAAARAAAKRKAAGARARIAAREEASSDVFLPPVAPLAADVSSSVTTEIAPVPTFAAMILFLGMALVVAAGFVPGVVLARRGVGVSSEVRLSVAAIGLTGFAIGLVMLLSAA